MTLCVSFLRWWLRRPMIPGRPAPTSGPWRRSDATSFERARRRSSRVRLDIDNELVADDVVALRRDRPGRRRRFRDRARILQRERVRGEVPDYAGDVVRAVCKSGDGDEGAVLRRRPGARGKIISHMPA